MSLPTVLQTKFKVFNDSSLHLRKTPIAWQGVTWCCILWFLSAFPTSPHGTFLQGHHIHLCICVNAQSYLTLCNPMDCRPPGSSVHGIFQARVLEWGAIAFSSHYAAAKSLQSYPTLCDPIDGRPPGSSVPGILQARTLEWVAIFFSNAWKWKVKVKLLSCVLLLATPWTAAYQAPLSMGFSRQEYWSGLPLPSGLSYTNLDNPS